MCVHEYKEKRSKLLLQLLTALESNDFAGESVLRQTMFELDIRFQYCPTITVR